MDNVLKRIEKAISDYRDHFKMSIPDDFSIRLKNPNDPKEWEEKINEAIKKNEPFEDEGVFDF